jgi:transcription antitermination factor NusG
MPILKAETALFPNTLLDEATSADTDRKWWAVYTKSRQEKALARQLEGMAIPFYLPLISQTTLLAGRRSTSLRPLFPSYLYVFGSENERVSALATKRATQILCARDSQLMTRDLANIRSLIEAGVPMTLESRLEPGRRVRVKHGALMGMEGKIVSRRGGDRLLVAVEFLQQGVSIEISDFQVEPL